MKSYDYCIIGTGLDGLVFADTILTHSDRTIAVIAPRADARRSKLQDAPIISRAMADDRIGLNSYTLRDWRAEFHNAYLNRTPTPLELHAYAEYVLEHRLIPSRRLERLTQVDYLGNDRFRARSGYDSPPPGVRHRVVRCPTKVDPMPSSCGRSFTVASSVQIVKPRILRAHAEMKHRTFDQYCVIGAGPVGTEMMLALIDLDIPVSKLKWVKPRDGWMLAPPKTLRTPPGCVNVETQALKTMAHARSTMDLSLRLEHLGMLTRATDDRVPTHLLPHIVSRKDAEKLRRVKGIVRKGHVHAISEIGMVLSHGAVPMPRRTLYLDCTGRRNYSGDPSPVFAEKTIELSPIRLSHPSFSAALIAATELCDLPVAQKNALCAPVGGSNLALCLLTSLLNHHAWFYNRDIRHWLETCRLDPALQSTAQKLNASETVPEELNTLRTILPRAIVNLESLVEQTGAVDPLRA